MKFIIDTTPKFCPGCGELIRWPDHFSTSDFYAGCAHTCRCGAQYQYVEEESIVDVAKQHGDSREYW